MKTMYTIHRKLKKPPLKGGAIGGGSKSTKYPWAQMEVGDCFCVGEYSARALTNILTSASHSWLAVNEGYEFQARKIEDKCYVWRTK